LLNGVLEADVVAATEYYPFGMSMPSRNYESQSDYRYGFNGQEKDNELYGEGNAYSFEYRVHDPRLGRFLSVDPLTKDFPWNSPYSFAENSPIRFIELEGRERAEPIMFELAKEMINSWKRDITTSGNDATLVRGLTRTQVLNQLTSMMNLVHSQTNISSCNNTGWYCGPLAALGAAAVNNPMAYASMVWDLVTTGKSNRDGDINKGLTLPDWVANADMSSGSFNGHNAIDMIMMYSLRGSENDNSAKGQDLINNYSRNGAGTLPWEMNDMFKRMGMGIAGQSFYRGQSNGTLKRLEKAVQNGFTPIIFDNEIITTADRNAKQKTDIGGGISLDVGIHYIVLLDFKRNKSNKTVDYTIMESGRKTTHTGVSYKDFKKGMKGYWIPKNK
jgi:RHS repeat-associated protein